MSDMKYVSPHTLDEAVKAFAAAGSAARILAGGTDLLVQMRSGMVKPGLIVDFVPRTGPAPDGRVVDGEWRLLDFTFHIAPVQE